MAEAQRDEIAKLEALYAANPEGRVFAHLAEAYRKAGELEHARDILLEGLRRHPDSASAFVVLGRVEHDRADSEAARVAFSRVLSLDAGNLIALRFLGDLALERGDRAEALRHYRELLNRDLADTSLENAVAELARQVAAEPAPAVEPAHEAAAGTPGAMPPEPEATAAPEPEATVAPGPISEAGGEPEPALAEPNAIQLEGTSAGVEEEAVDEAVVALGGAEEAPAAAGSAEAEELLVGWEPPAAEAEDLALEAPMALAGFDTFEAGPDELEELPFLDLEEGTVLETFEPEFLGLEEEAPAAELADTGYPGPDLESEPGELPEPDLPYLGFEEEPAVGGMAEVGFSEPAPADLAEPEEPTEALEAPEVVLEVEPEVAWEPEPEAAEVAEALELAVEVEPGVEAAWELAAAAEPETEVGAGVVEAVGPEAPFAEQLPGAAGAEAGGDLVLEEVFEAPAETLSNLDDLTAVGDFQHQHEAPADEAAAPGLLTETMADLYRRQGFSDRAAEVYRSLLERDPGNGRLRDLLAETEAEHAAMLARQVREGAPATPEWLRDVHTVESAFTGAAGAAAGADTPYAWAGPGEEVQPAGPSIGEYFRNLLAWRPAGAAPAEIGPELLLEDVVPGVPAAASAPEEVRGEGPGEGAAEAPSDLLPWEVAGPAALAGPGSVEPAETRSGAAPETAAPRSDAEAESEAEDEDLEMFRAWLQSLKK